MNHEEQYSIWPAEREDALGWKNVGKVGPKTSVPLCTAILSENWFAIFSNRIGNDISTSSTGNSTKVSEEADCLAYIKEVWTDMRPLSLRKRMENGGGNEEDVAASFWPKLAFAH
jgi:MbtH protein